MVSSHAAADAAGMPEAGASCSYSSTTAAATITNYGVLSVSKPKPIGASVRPKKEPSRKRMSLVYDTLHRQNSSFREALCAAVKLQAEAASTNCKSCGLKHSSCPEVGAARPVSADRQCRTQKPLE